MVKREKANIGRPKLQLPEDVQRQLPASAEALAKSLAKRKKTDIVALKLRLREHLRKRLETAAKAQERSLNSEIVGRLEESFVKDRSLAERAQVAEVLGAYEKNIKSVIDAIDGVKREQQAYDAKWEARLMRIDPKVAEQFREMREEIEEEYKRERQQEGTK